MRQVGDAFWRAAAYCLHPRIILWSLAPLLLAGSTVLGLGWWYWEPTVDAVRVSLEEWALVSAAFDWLQSVGAGNLRTLIAPLIVVAVTLPLVIVMSLLLVALLMMPAIVDLVSSRRFQNLERRLGAGWFTGMLWSLTCTGGALLALVLSMPLWLVPPLILILPPLIWGWLSYRVFAFDAMASHASAAERHQIMREHRGPLLAIGIMAGYLGAAPALVWALGAMTLVLAPLLIVVSVWLYTLVFAFTAAWFTHYTLAALQDLRKRPEMDPAAAVEVLAAPRRGSGFDDAPVSNS